MYVIPVAFAIKMIKISFGGQHFQRYVERNQVLLTSDGFTGDVTGQGKDKIMRDFREVMKDRFPDQHVDNRHICWSWISTTWVSVTLHRAPIWAFVTLGQVKVIRVTRSVLWYGPFSLMKCVCGIYVCGILSHWARKITWKPRSANGCTYIRVVQSYTSLEKLSCSELVGMVPWFMNTPGIKFCQNRSSFRGYPKALKMSDIAFSSPMLIIFTNVTDPLVLGFFLFFILFSFFYTHSLRKIKFKGGFDL